LIALRSLTRCSVGVCARASRNKFVPDSAHAPIPCTGSRQAETISAAVQIVFWGMLGSIRRGIAAVPELRDQIVTAGPGAYPNRT